MREPGDVVPGIGVYVACHECRGAGWVLDLFVSGVKQVCPRCGGVPVLLDDGAQPKRGVRDE